MCKESEEAKSSCGSTTSKDVCARNVSTITTTTTTIIQSASTTSPCTTLSTMDQQEGTESVPKLSQAEYTEQLETHQALIQAKSAQLTRLSEVLKSVRESKEPLAEVRNTLQEEINNSNKAINSLSEEVTHLKQKLRYHSLKQIQGNIERLEYLLRNNNYKPREEQKILDEISMLQRSTRTLKEYEAKQAENKKYRTERARLIEERNNNFSKIRALYAQEDEIKKEIAHIRADIAANKRAVEHLRLIRPRLEQEWRAAQKKVHLERHKKIEEKKRLRQEQMRERQEEKRKLWEEYEASLEPFEEEKNMCHVLIRYLQCSVVGGATPSTPASLPSSSGTPHLTPATTPSGSSLPSLGATTTPGDQDDQTASLMLPPPASGSFYTKPKDDVDSFPRVNKRKKAKAKKENRLANKVKELPHTPDVLLKFSRLSIAPPKTTDQVTATLVSLHDCLQKFHILSLQDSSVAVSVEDYSDASARQAKSERPTNLALKCDSSSSHSDIKSQDVTAIASPSPIQQQTACVTTPATEHIPSASSKAGTTNEASPTLWEGAAALPEPSQPTPAQAMSVPTSPSNTTGPLSLPLVNGPLPPKQNPTSPTSLPGCAVLDISPNVKVCRDILTPGSNSSESFFSVPMSYQGSVEPKPVVEPNNNSTTFSYAAVAAKTKPGASLL